MPGTVATNLSQQLMAASRNLEKTLGNSGLSLSGVSKGSGFQQMMDFSSQSLEGGKSGGSLIEASDPLADSAADSTSTTDKSVSEADEQAEASEEKPVQSLRDLDESTLEALKATLSELQQAPTPEAREAILAELDPAMLEMLNELPAIMQELASALMVHNQIGVAEQDLMQQLPEDLQIALKVFSDKEGKGLQFNRFEGTDLKQLGVNKQFDMGQLDKLLATKVTEDKLLSEVKGQLLSQQNNAGESRPAIDLRGLNQFVNSQIQNENYKSAFNQVTQSGSQPMANFQSLLGGLAPKAVAATGFTGAPVVPTSQQFGQMVAANAIYMIGNSIQAANLSIYPPDSGQSLEVKVSVEGDQTKLHFVSPNSAVQSNLMDSFPKLQEMLEQFGLELSEEDVSYQYQEQAEQEQLAQQQAGGANGSIDETLNDESDEVTTVRRQLGLLDDYA